MSKEKINPLFKYIGGKTWLKDNLRNEIDLLLSQLNKFNIISTNQNSPNETYYIEPFAGGLGAFLGVYDILLKHQVKNVILNDINTNLISFYHLVQTKPQSLIKSYMILEDQFLKTIPSLTGLHLIKDKDKIKKLLDKSNLFYQQIRAEYNELRSKNKNSTNSTLAIASRLLFLQNHSFNGIYRENSKGEFNTPFNWSGKYYSKEKINEKIMDVHSIFKLFNIEFSNTSYSNLNYSLNGVYYLDPPYLNDITTQENKYHKNIFGLLEQEDLIKKISSTYFLYSNHDSKILSQLFKKHVQHNYKINKISRKNIISSSIESRKIDKIEILVSHQNK